MQGNSTDFCEISLSTIKLILKHNTNTKFLINKFDLINQISN